MEVKCPCYLWGRGRNVTSPPITSDAIRWCFSGLATPTLVFSPFSVLSPFTSSISVHCLHWKEFSWRLGHSTEIVQQEDVAQHPVCLLPDGLMSRHRLPFLVASVGNG